jgi:hypothetical protein
VRILTDKQRPEEDSGLVDEGKSFNLSIRWLNFLGYLDRLPSYNSPLSSAWLFTLDLAITISQNIPSYSQLKAVV